MDDDLQPDPGVTQPLSQTAVRSTPQRSSTVRVAEPPSVQPTVERVEIPRIVPAEPQVADEPVPAPTERQMVVRKGGRPRVRRVTRVVRHVDTWSVFKVSLVFSLFLYAVLLTAGVLLWQVAQNTGTIDNVERFMESFGWETFTFNGGQLFHNLWVIGLLLVFLLTGLAVLGATVFNLIADLVGGVRVTVLEEEVVLRVQEPNPVAADRPVEGGEIDR